MKEVQLTQGYTALVDDVDYELVSQHKWQVQKGPNTYYAQTKLSRKLNNGKQKSLTMHGLIMDTLPGQQVDHKNGDGFDNRRENLRLCDNKQNQGNQRIRVGTSIYKGVCWHSRHKKWYATIRMEGKTNYLGCFSSEDDAAKAYDRVAREYYGEFAHLNFAGDWTLA